LHPLLTNKTLITVSICIKLIPVDYYNVLELIEKLNAKEQKGCYVSDIGLKCFKQVYFLR